LITTTVKVVLAPLLTIGSLTIFVTERSAVGVAVGVEVAVAVGVEVGVGVGDGGITVTVAHPTLFPEVGSSVPGGGAIEAQFVPVAVTVTVTSRA
jgi:hypothetical protein